MGFYQFFMTNRRVALVAAFVVAGAVWLWLGPLHGRVNPTVPVSGKAPSATANPEPDSAFADADTKLKELIKRQQVLSQQTTDIAATQRNEGATAARSAGPVSDSGKSPSADAGRKQMDALMAARDAAVEEIRQAGPGNTKKIIAAVEKLDAQMRAAGYPSVLDMPKFRQMMISVDRIQEISKQLNAETQKGQQADPAKIQSLLKEMSAEQAAMPKSPYNTEALEKAMKSGH